MSGIPEDLRYTKSHEWVRKEEDGNMTIGISDHAQELLGDLVFVEVPEVGRMLDEAEDCAVVESVKAASDVYSPVAGEVVAVNEDLEESPQSLNEDPYGDGWIFRVKPSNSDAYDGLMDAKAYSEHLENEDH